MADVVSELLARRGYARAQASEDFAKIWEAAAGEMMAKYTRTGTLKRGVLEVIVAHSALVQELTFQKIAILEKLARLAPDEGIKDIRCRVGPLE